MPRIGSKAALKAYLRERVGWILESLELQQAANGAVQYSRRLRELREEGWRISSNNDRADLTPGQYVLEELPPEDGYYSVSRAISKRVRAEALERNGYTCQMCGAGAGDVDEQNPARKVRLHIGHIQDRSHGGTDALANLRALCSTCNQGAKNLVQEPPTWSWLLGRVRTAREDDQRRILEWLQRKFERT